MAYSYSYANYMATQNENILKNENTIDNSQESEVASTVEFLKSTWGTLNFWIIVVLLSANLLVYIFNLVLPYKIKNKEMDIEKYKLTISKKLKYIETVHSLMCEISDNILFVAEEQNNLIAKLTKMNTYSGMYFKSETKELINHFIDAAISQKEKDSIEQLGKFEEWYRQNKVL